MSQKKVLLGGWNNQKSLRLIKAFENATVLWSPCYACSKHNNAKDRAWAMIAALFGKKEAEVKKKLEILQSCYRREMFREVRAAKEHPNHPFKSQWFAYDAFKFLRDAYVDRPIHIRKRSLDPTGTESVHLECRSNPTMKRFNRVISTNQTSVVYSKQTPVASGSQTSVICSKQTPVASGSKTSVVSGNQTSVASNFTTQSLAIESTAANKTLSPSPPPASPRPPSPGLPYTSSLISLSSFPLSLPSPSLLVSPSSSPPGSSTSFSPGVLSPSPIPQSSFPPPIENFSHSISCTETPTPNLVSASRVEEDECRSYGDLVTAKLRKFNENQRFHLMYSLSETIYQHELNFYSLS